MLAAALLTLGTTALPALAVTSTEGSGLPVPYVAAFAPVFGVGVPYAGTMRLLVQGGTISGSYTGISVRPDRFDNRIEPVVGTLDDEDGYVQLTIGNALSFTGTMDKDGTIAGTATYGGRLYEFTAEPGSPGRPNR
jgi:hypothetical protein